MHLLGGGRREAVLAAWVVVSSLGCTTERMPPEPTPTASHGPDKPVLAPPVEVPASAGMRPTKASLRAAGASEAFVEKVAENRFRYFRMMAAEFEARTCSAFEDLRWRLPVVAVHGDAHLEQFVVTGATYGLEDFDRSGFGPAIVDMVRYASSIHVACREVSFPCDAESATERYLNAYRDALEKIVDVPAAPDVVSRIRAKAPLGADAWLAWADSLTTPLPADTEAEARGKWAEFGALLSEIHPEIARSTYDVQKVGALRMGFGSGLEEKLLFRIQGPTGAPGDDAIVEVRAGDAPERTGCIWRPDYGSSYVLMFMSLLGRRMPDIHGFMPLHGDTTREFWVQSWDPGYQELSLADLQSQADVEELATDAAHQLAGHFWTRFPEALRAQQRYAQLRAFDLSRDRAVVLARDLAGEVESGWQAFRAGE